MIPLRDDVPTRIPAVISISLIVANAVVFLYEWPILASPSPVATAFFETWGLVPREFLRGAGDPGATEHLVWLTPFTSMFLHAGALHLISNMLFLWIFGNNVEDLLGHGRFLVFYVGCGLAAAATQVASNPASHVPVVGASGAIGGVIGAYLLAYPRAHVLTLVPIGFFWTTVRVPAVAFIGIWFVIQLLSGVGSLGRDGGGVAWWAHIGGFLTGVVLLRPMRVRAPLPLRAG